jgi:hypothetical protein
MSNSQKSKKSAWSVSGKLLKGGRAVNGTINYEEDVQNSASTPVNGPLAVSLIKELVINIPGYILYPEIFDPLSQQVLDAYRAAANVTGAQPGTAGIPKQIVDVAEKVKVVEDLLIRLLRNSIGITVDKPTIMKALGQTNCEGLRFYQCISTEPGTVQQVLSLVVVAVDAKGNDLAYTFDPAIKKEIEKIVTSSFSAEYNLTSGPVSFLELDDSNEQLKPYVLLKYALNATDRPIEAESVKQDEKESKSINK